MSLLLDAIDRSAPEGLGPLRARAKGALKAKGLPSNKDEAWRFTSVRSLLAQPFEAEPLVTSPAVKSQPGVTVSVVAASDPSLSQLGAIAPVEHFAALNAALFTEVTVVRVEPGAIVAEPIVIARTVHTTKSPTVTYPRTLVIVGEGARATIVESYSSEDGPALLVDAVTEVVLGARAQLHHTRWAQPHRSAFHIGHLAVGIAEGAQYTSTVLALGGGLNRLDLRAELTGPGAHAGLDGVYLAGESEHVDHHIEVVHSQLKGTSRQRYRGILHGNAEGVFDGTIIVAHGASGTDAHQENRNLLLSENASVHTKPHLRIDTDDVKCSHGATVGALDEDQLFYLRTRGIDRGAAEAILARAFAESILQDVADASTRENLLRLVSERLP